MVLTSLSSAYAADFDVDLTTGTFADNVITWTVGTDLTIVQHKGKSGTVVNKSYIAGPRLYKGHYLCFTATGDTKIAGVEITYTGSYKGSDIVVGSEVVDDVVTPDASITASISTQNNGKHTFTSADGVSVMYIQNSYADAKNYTQLRPSAIKVIIKEEVSATAPAKPTLNVTGKVYAEEYIYEPISIALNAEEGDIYYTTDDSEFSTDTWTMFDYDIVIDKTTTLRAVAYNGTEASEELKVDYTFLDLHNGILALREEMVNNGKAFVKLTDAVITGSFGNYGYVEDADAGIALYQVGDLDTGTKLNGIVLVKTSIYSNLKQVNAILDQSELTFTDAAEIPTTIVTMSEFLANRETYESRHIKMESVTSVKDFGGTKSATISLGEDELTVYANNSKELVMTEGRVFDITGWGGVYGTTPQLLVYNQEDIYEIPSSRVDAETAWASETVAILAGEAWTVSNTVTTKSDAPVIYSSSNESVATVDAEGNITVLAYGNTVITAATAETDNFYSSEASMKLYVVEGTGQLGAPYTVTDATYCYDMAITDKVWVMGTIIGYYANNALVEGVDGALASNMAIGTVDANIPVQLSNNGTPIREMYNLQDNPTALGTMVYLYGNVQSYYGTVGLKNVTGYSLDGTTGINSVQGDETEAPIYDLAGRRVAKAGKGIYVSNGKKIMVK